MKYIRPLKGNKAIVIKEVMNKIPKKLKKP